MKYIAFLFLLGLIGVVIVYFAENPIGPLKIVSEKIVPSGDKGYTYSVVIHNQSSVPHSGFLKINTDGYLMQITRRGASGYPKFVFKDITLQPNETVTIEDTISSNWMFNAHVETTK